MSNKLTKIKATERFFLTLGIALLIIIAGIVMTCVKGINFGIEFTGGIKVSIDVDAYAPSDFKSEDFQKDIKAWLEGDRNGDGSIDESAKQYKVEDVSLSGTNYVFTLGTKMVKDGKTVDIEDLKTENDEIRTQLGEHIKEYFTTKYSSVETDGIEDIVKPNFVGNESTKWIIRSAIIAVAVAIVVILIYVAIRFTLISGLAAILALIHNVAIMFACTALFRVHVNSTFIAAIITIIGYSINSTIVVFDKVRELEKRPSYVSVSDRDIANEAVGSTLKRTILTTATTLVMIVLLAVFGTQSIKEFAYPIIFGLISGAYSSILLAAPTWVYLRKLFKQADKRPTKKIKAVQVENTTIETENA